MELIRIDDALEGAQLELTEEGPQVRLGVADQSGIDGVAAIALSPAQALDLARHLVAWAERRRRGARR